MRYRRAGINPAPTFIPACRRGIIRVPHKKTPSKRRGGLYARPLSIHRKLPSCIAAQRHLNELACSQNRPLKTPRSGTRKLYFKPIKTRESYYKQMMVLDPWERNLKSLSKISSFQHFLLLNAIKSSSFQYQNIFL